MPKVQVAQTFTKHTFFLYIKRVKGIRPMNYTLKELQQRVESLIDQHGEDAHCGAWIYTKNDCFLKDEDGNIDYDNTVKDPEVIERIFDDVGNIDYIYQVIQECVDEVVEEQVMLQQQELAEVE